VTETQPSSAGTDWQQWVSLLARVALGGPLIWAGIAKAGNPGQFAAAVRAYRLGLPDGLTKAIANLLPVFEIVAGGALLLGLFTRATAVLCALALAAFTAVLVSAWVRGLQIDCGCFGQGGELDPGARPAYALGTLRNVGLLGCGAWAAVFPRSPLSLDHWVFGDAKDDATNQTDEGV
jgi:uncharacterized membrane protein YphA (DoxX/SURF4 family)